MHIRITLPNVFTSSGYREPFGFSNSTAGPTLLGLRFVSRAIRCVTSVISNTGSTSARTRFNSPALSNSVTNSRKSRYATWPPYATHAVVAMNLARSVPVSSNPLHRLALHLAIDKARIDEPFAQICEKFRRKLLIVPFVQAFKLL